MVSSLGGFTTPSKVMVMFNLMRFVTFNISRALSLACKDSMFSLLVVFALGNARIYVYLSNHGNIISYFEAVID